MSDIKFFDNSGSYVRSVIRDVVRRDGTKQNKGLGASNKGKKRSYKQKMKQKKQGLNSKRQVSKARSKKGKKM